jgi:uncharacterized heparinase superfamily protein
MLGQALQYVHTIRYLKPVQVLGRIWFRLHTPTVRATPPLSIRERSGEWRRTPIKKPFLLSPLRFQFLNEVHEIKVPSDWNNPQWDKLWLYHLHYFDGLNAEGAGLRTAWHTSLIGQWIAENPVGWGNGWEPYPLSRRIVNWMQWGWAGNELTASATESLVVQARFLRKRLEWHLMGNHLLANAKALIFAGLFFDGAEANGWLAKGAAIFSDQLEEQILADGGHFERSPMYHAQVLNDILDVINALQAYPDIPFAGRDALQERCGNAARRMLGWSALMSHPDGGIALLNDAAFGDAAEPGALMDYAEHLGIAPSAMPSTVSSDGDIRMTPLLETGYIRVEGGGMVAFLDTAPIGPDYLPGHAHADTLGFELSLGRQRVIVDSGVSRYGEGPERLRQRGTAAHNTVTIDGMDSSEVWGGFRVARRAYPHDLRIRESEGVVSCAHDGYRHLPGKPVHRREWRFRSDSIQVSDTITGSFLEAVGRLHFHPSVRLASSSDDCTAGRIVLPDGHEMRWQITKGRGRLCETTWHPEFGLSIPNQCLEIGFIERETVIRFRVR